MNLLSLFCFLSPLLACSGAGNFDKATGAGKEKPFLVMFWASWCNACHTTLHSLDEAARTLHHEDGIGVAKVEVAKHNALRKRFSAVVHAFPTIVLLRDGKMYKLPARDHQSSKMVEFARSTYKNVQPLPIPSGPSILDTIRSQCASLLRCVAPTLFAVCIQPLPSSPCVFSGHHPHGSVTPARSKSSANRLSDAERNVQSLTSYARSLSRR